MRKIIIGICDDMPEAIAQIHDIIAPYLAEVKEETEVLHFESGEAVLEVVEKLDILFLDIEMPGMDGIEVGERLRKENPECKVIMATSKIERFKEAFKIAAYRFVSKPFEEEEVLDALVDALKTKMGLETITFHEMRNAYEIPQKEIHAITTYGSFVEAHIGKERMRKEVSLRELMEELDKRFFYQIDRSHIVNFMHINHYSDGRIEMENEEYIVSRRRKKDFEKAFREFDVTYGR